MAAKKNIYIEAELDFAEIQLSKWKQYIDENPYNEVEDRKELMKTKTGGAYYAVVQTKEAIQKSLRDTMKEYLLLLKEVNGMREVEDAKKEARGKGIVPPRMQ
jgi:hypothetical protein